MGHSDQELRRLAMSWKDVVRYEIGSCCCVDLLYVWCLGISDNKGNSYLSYPDSAGTCAESSDGAQTSGPQLSSCTNGFDGEDGSQRMRLCRSSCRLGGWK